MRASTSPVLRLPPLHEETVPAAGLVQRTVTLTLIGLGMMVALAVGAASLVSVNITVRASGALEPAHLWPVRTRESGTVIEVLVSTGDSVMAGQPLVRLDTGQLAASVAQLRASLMLARLDYQRAVVSARLTRTERAEQRQQAAAAVLRARALLRQQLPELGFPDDVDSLLRTYRPGTRTMTDLALAEVMAADAQAGVTATPEHAVLDELDLEKGRAQRQQLAAQIAFAEAHLARMIVRAPAAGIILTDRVERLKGTFVREGDQLMELADPGMWHAALYVVEHDMRKVRPGDEVRLEVPALAPDRDAVEGRVVFVAEEPVAPDTPEGMAHRGLYRVVAAVDPVTTAATGLRRGYTVRGKIVAGSGRILALLWRHLRGDP